MIVEHNKYIEEHIGHVLSHRQTSSEVLKAMRTLEVLPDKAVVPEIHDGLLSLLLEPNEEGFYCNYLAAKLLIDICDPEGIKHLVYYSLSVHPIHKTELSKYSGWSCSNLIARKHLVTDEYFKLFVQDMISSPYGCHIDLFTALPDELVLDRLTELLAHPAEHVSFVAAAALAMKGDDAGRSILVGHIGDLSYTRRAMIALSHIPDGKFIDLLNLYYEGDPESYKKFPNMELIWRSVAKERLALVEALSSSEPSAFIDMVKRWHQFPARETVFGPILTKLKQDYRFYIWTADAPAWLLEGKYVVPTLTADILHEFSTADQRKYLAEEQEKQIRSLLDEFDNPTHAHKNDMLSGISHLVTRGLPYISTRDDLPSFLPSVSVTYEKKDYIKYSIDWILHPEKYLYGSCFKM